MKDKLKEGLAELLSMLVKTLEKGGEFVVDQAPLVVQEFLNWGIAQGVLLIVLGISLAIITYFVTVFTYRKERKPKIGYVMVGCLGATGSIIPLICGIYKVTFIIVAPRVYIIEHISKML